MVLFSLSPAVTVQEYDLTTIIPSVDTTTAGFAGQFQWGPIEKRMAIADQIDLVARVFKPDSNTFLSFFTCANFLDYSNSLIIVRAGNSTLRNATEDASGLYIKNEDAYENAYYTGAGSVGAWAARYSGSLGNSLKVSICPSSAAFSNTIALTANTTSGSNLVVMSSNAQGIIAVGDYISVGSADYIKVTAVANMNVTLSTTFSSTLVANTTARRWEYYDSFDGAPGTSQFADLVNGVDDEVHIVVVDEDGSFTGTANTILERFPFYSKASDARSSDGTSLYYRDALFQRSQYIYWMDHISGGTNWGNTAANTTFTTPILPVTSSLSGGVTATSSTADLMTAWDMFAGTEEVDVPLLLTGAADITLANYVLSTIAEGRKDTVAFISPMSANVVNNNGNEDTACVAFRNNFPSSSYGFMDNNWKYMFDKYNNVYRWVPMNGDTAGLHARTDLLRAPWYPGAGYNRGIFKNVVKLAWSPKKNKRDILFKNGINPIFVESGFGAILLGDKTMLSKPSAFNEIGVRRLFILLEKAIATAAKFTLFEFNDEFTRAQFVSQVDPFLRDIMGRRGITAKRVVCDETNNTPQVIDSNQFIGDIYVKPNRSIRDIQLRFVAVATGVSFDEVVGKFF